MAPFLLKVFYILRNEEFFYRVSDEWVVTSGQAQKLFFLSNRSLQKNILTLFFIVFSIFDIIYGLLVKRVSKCKCKRPGSFPLINKEIEMKKTGQRQIGFI